MLLCIAIFLLLGINYNHFVATCMWFQAVAYYGAHADKPNYDYLAHELHTIVRLNPKFQPVYYMAASALPWGMHSTRLSQDFTLQAMLEFPDDWRWAYYRGFNSYWFENNFKQAAHFFEISAQKPNAPNLVTSLALRMHAHTGSLQTGLQFLQGLLQKNNDSKLQAQLLKQYHMLQTEQELRNIEKLLARLPHRQRNAADLEQLKRLGYQLPTKLADGGSIEVLKDGSLLSSHAKKRFQLFIPKKHQGVKINAAH